MISAQQIPCDDCGRPVTVIAQAPRYVDDVDTAAGEIGCSVAPVALAWADTHFTCARCCPLHPSMRSYLARFH